MCDWKHFLDQHSATTRARFATKSHYRLGAADRFCRVLFCGWIEKFTAGPGSEWITIFAKIGWGDWFRYFAGAVETLGALLMLVPRTTLAGTSLLACAMLGAILAHCFKLGGPFASVIPLGLLVITLVVGRKLSAKLESITRLEL